jgi:hypothetical protein
MASRCQSAVSALPRNGIVDSLEFGQLEMATSLYPCRMCVIDKRLCDLYCESFFHKYTSIRVHAALLTV